MSIKVTSFTDDFKANEDRLENILNAGNAIVEQNAEQAHLINEKTTSLKEKFAELDEACVSRHGSTRMPS